MGDCQFRRMKKASFFAVPPKHLPPHTGLARKPQDTRKPTLCGVSGEISIEVFMIWIPDLLVRGRTAYPLPATEPRKISSPLRRVFSGTDSPSSMAWSRFRKARRAI